jgi:hypothetical protein
MTTPPPPHPVPVPFPLLMLILLVLLLLLFDVVVVRYPPTERTPHRRVVRGLCPAHLACAIVAVRHCSVYTLWRNQHKFEKRCKSKRHRIQTAVFRLDTVSLMVRARKMLVRPRDTLPRASLSMCVTLLVVLWRCRLSPSSPPS